MGFIGGYVVPEFGITEYDLKDAYYLIDKILFNSDITTNDEVNIIIIFNIYSSKSDRTSRINLLGSREVTKTINRSEFTGNILEQLYQYSKPLLIEEYKIVLTYKLKLDIIDQIPSEYSEYYSLVDDL